MDCKKLGLALVLTLGIGATGAVGSSAKAQQPTAQLGGSGQQAAPPAEPPQAEVPKASKPPAAAAAAKRRQAGIRPATQSAALEQ